jgi:hypothetical protein
LYRAGPLLAEKGFADSLSQAPLHRLYTYTFKNGLEEPFDDEPLGHAIGYAAALKVK